MKKLFILLFMALFLPTISLATESKNAVLQEISKLLGTLQTTQRKRIDSQSESEQPRYLISTDGYLRHIGAPPLRYFPVTNVFPDKPDETGYNFIEEHRNLFGARSPSVDFTLLKLKFKENRSYVRLNQTYRDIPIFGAQIIVQLNNIGGVESVMSDISRNTEVLDSGLVSTEPTIASDQVITLTIDLFAQKYPNVEIITSIPILEIFDPSVVGCNGNIRLVWDIKVMSKNGVYVSEHLLIDAHSNEIVRCYPMNIFALNRKIYDSNNDRTAGSGTLLREEGDGPSGIADVDDAYRFLEDIYDFYNTHHGRDSIDDNGIIIRATVRYCSPNPNDSCPYNNAFWSSSKKRMYFGDGYVVDDIVGHEYTHGVTDYESNLIYENHSGAINESFSDIWGEFIDLGNGEGTDTTMVRWLIGEDLPGGALRDMQDPPLGSDPDRLGHPNFVPIVNDPKRQNDFGGVHTNCGVNNKLCYLLTDGDTFRGYSVQGMGVNRVADLYYEVNTKILTSGADYFDLYYALKQAAVNLGWNIDERNNLCKAFKAVEIIRERDIYVDGKYTGLFEFGTKYFPYNTIIEGYSALYPGDRLIIKAGSYNEFIIFKKIMEIRTQDGPVVIGK